MNVAFRVTSRFKLGTLTNIRLTDYRFEIMEKITWDSAIDTRNREFKIVMEGHFYLTEKDIIQALNAELIMVHGTYYHTPKEQLIELLYERKNGLVKLTLTEYENTESEV